VCVLCHRMNVLTVVHCVCNCDDPLWLLFRPAVSCSCTHRSQVLKKEAPSLYHTPPKRHKTGACQTWYTPDTKIKATIGFLPP